jgi:hypothetical protein
MILDRVLHRASIDHRSMMMMMWGPVMSGWGSSMNLDRVDGVPRSGPPGCRSRVGVRSGYPGVDPHPGGSGVGSGGGPRSGPPGPHRGPPIRGGPGGTLGGRFGGSPGGPQNRPLREGVRGGSRGVTFGGSRGDPKSDPPGTPQK